MFWRYDIYIHSGTVRSFYVDWFTDTEVMAGADAYGRLVASDNNITVLKRSDGLFKPGLYMIGGLPTLKIMVSTAVQCWVKQQGSF